MARPAAFDDGALARVLLGPLKLALTVFAIAAGLLTAAVLVQLAWTSRNGLPGDGIEALRSLLRHEVTAGTVLAHRQGGSPRSITGPANALYALVFDASGLHAMGQRFSDPAHASIPDTLVRRAWVAHQHEITVAMLATQLVGVRAATLIHLLPWLMLMAALGGINGLAQRGLRRESADAESASLYHRAKYAQVALLGLGGALILIWPLPVAWEWVSAIAGTALAWLASVQWAFYKKRV
jgi:hypothetical protein